jgi:single-strand DNA-binding protein
MKTLRNRVQLIGRLGQEPEIKELTNGRKMAKFSIATNEYYFNKDGEKVEETNWHNLVAFGKTAELIEQYRHKGDEVIVDGRLTSHTYTDKNDEKRFAVEVVVSECLGMSKISNKIAEPA